MKNSHLVRLSPKSFKKKIISKILFFLCICFLFFFIFFFCYPIVYLANFVKQRKRFGKNPKWIRCDLVRSKHFFPPHLVFCVFDLRCKKKKTNFRCDYPPTSKRTFFLGLRSQSVFLFFGQRGFFLVSLETERKKNFQWQSLWFWLFVFCSGAILFFFLGENKSINQSINQSNCFDPFDPLRCSDRFLFSFDIIWLFCFSFSFFFLFFLFFVFFCFWFGNILFQIQKQSNSKSKMPSIYDFRHVELDKVGRGKRFVLEIFYSSLD